MGYVYRADGYRFVSQWTGASMKQLASLPGNGNPYGIARSITDAGDIVGASRSQAVIWRE